MATSNPYDFQSDDTPPSGLVASRMTSNGTATVDPATVAQAKAGTAQASTWNVSGNQTVQGQLDGILAKNSPLLQRAQALSDQKMNDRGLLNSSLAVGAGQTAVLDAATPIATADANTYAAAGKSNAELGTQTSIANANNTTSTNQFNANQSNSAGQFNAGEVNKTTLADKNIAAQQALQTGQQTFTAGQSALDRAQQTALQTSQQNYTAAQAALDRAQQVALQDKSLAAQQALQAAQQTFQGAQAELDRAQQSNLQTGQQGFLAGQSALDRAQQQSLADKQIAAQAALQAANNGFQKELAAYQASIQQAMQASDLASKDKLAQLDASVKTNLANIEAQYKDQMQASASMAQSFQSYMDSITKVIQDQGITDVNVKNSLINQLSENYKGMFAVQSQVTGVDLTGLLGNGGTTSPAPAPATGTPAAGPAPATGAPAPVVSAPSIPAPGAAPAPGLVSSAVPGLTIPGASPAPAPAAGGGASSDQQYIWVGSGQDAYPVPNPNWRGNYNGGQN